MMKSDQNSPATVPRRITPKSLIISRDGFMQVQLRASVTGSEALFFLVPRAQMQQAIDSLQISDSRGTTTRVTFPSSSFPPNHLSIRADEAWSDLVHEQQGSYVQLFMGSDCAEGHLIGLRNQTAEKGGKSSVLLLRDSQVSAYDIETVSAISFRNSSSSAKLKKYTASREFDMDTKDYYRITITTTGSGPGIISVSYSQHVEGTPFNISYSASMPDGVSAYGIYPKMLLKCFAIIPNPLPCDLEDVEVTLQGQIYQSFRTQVVYENAGVEDSVSTKSDSSSQSEEWSNETTESPSDVDQIFDNSSSYLSQASVEGFYDSSRTVFAKTSLSLKEGECARVLLFETRCEGGLVYFFSPGRKQCALEFFVRNTSDRDLQPGQGQFSSPDIESTCPIILRFLKKGDSCLCIFRLFTGIRGKGTSESAMEKVIACSKVDNKLLATVMYRRTALYELHNLTDQDVDVIVFHETGQSSRTEVEIEAKWCKNLKRVGVSEQESKPIVIQPYCINNFNRTNRYFHGRACSKERCSLVVTEKVTKDVEIPLLDDVSVKRIANLEKNNMIGIKTRERLIEILEIERKIELLSRRRSLHRRRLETLIKHQHKEAEKELEEKENPGSSEQDEKRDCKGVRSTFMRAVSRSDNEMTEIQEILDDIDRKLISSKHELKSKKKILTENQSLD